MAAYRWFGGYKEVPGDHAFRIVLVLSGWPLAVWGVARMWDHENYGMGLVVACLIYGVLIAVVVLTAGVWGASPERSWRRWFTALCGKDPYLAAPMIVEVPVVPTDGVLDPEEYADRFHRVLDLLDIPVELDGTHVTIGKITDAEREMVEPIVAIMKTRLPHAEVRQKFPLA